MSTAPNIDVGYERVVSEREISDVAHLLRLVEHPDGTTAISFVRIAPSLTSLRGLGAGLLANEADLPHEASSLDIEREIVLRMQPRSRRSVTVQVPTRAVQSLTWSPKRSDPSRLLIPKAVTCLTTTLGTNPRALRILSRAT